MSLVCIQSCQSIPFGSTCSHAKFSYHQLGSYDDFMVYELNKVARKLRFKMVVFMAIMLMMAAMKGDVSSCHRVQQTPVL